MISRQSDRDLAESTSVQSLQFWRRFSLVCLSVWLFLGFKTKEERGGEGFIIITLCVLIFMANNIFLDLKLLILGNLQVSSILSTKENICYVAYG